MMGSYGVLGVMACGYPRAFACEVQRDLMERHARGELRVPLAGLVPFDALPSALERLGAGQVSGKLVLAGPAGSARAPAPG